MVYTVLVMLRWDERIRSMMPPDAHEAGQGIKMVGLRMPYDLPLVKYEKEDVPWVATMRHTEPDWMGNVWG